MAGDTGMAGKVALLLWAQTLGLAGAQTTQLLVEPPWTPAVLWDRVTLTCQGSGTAGATTWYKDRKRWWQKGPNHFTVNTSGTYQCDRAGTGLSPRIRVLNVPVANATITPGPLSHQVHAGDPVTLRCSVQVGSAPVTFIWLHDGQEVARGPVLDLGDVDVGHSGTYQCVATNQLGQDGHQMFWALSPKLALEVTSWGHGCTDARKHQERAPSVPLAPLGEDSQATYMELQGPHGQPWEPSDIYDSLQQKL